MMPSKTRYNDRKYIARAKALRKKRLPCWICHRDIDYDADWRDSMSFTADHIKPMAHGGNLYGELRPAHRGCNSRRGTGKEIPAEKKPPAQNSIRW